VDDGTPPPSDEEPARPASHAAAPKTAAPKTATARATAAKAPSGKSNGTKSNGTKSGAGKSAATKTAGSRSTGARSSSSRSKQGTTDPRNETAVSNGTARGRPTPAAVIDPLLSQPVAIIPVETDSVVSVVPVVAIPEADEQIDAHIDRLLADEADSLNDSAPLNDSSLVNDLMPVDETGRIELPVIVPAERDPELDADTEAEFGTDLPTQTVALVEPVPPVVVAPMLPDQFEPFEPFDTGLGDTDGTDGLPSMARAATRPRRLRAPVVMRRRRRPRVRRVTRVVRQVDTWSVFKVALVFSLFLYGVVLTAGVLLWKVAQNTGTIDNVQRFFESFGWKSFTLKGGAIFHQAWVAGLFVVVGFTGFAVLVATLFNLITDLVGGIRVTVLEEEVVAREDRGLGWRRASRRETSRETDHEIDGGLEPDSPVG
jgi:hypothetical protein